MADEETRVEWVSIGDLLVGPRKVSIAALATAIESAGLHFWDRFGRCVPKAAESEEASRALDLIARVYADRQVPVHMLTSDPDDLGGEDSPFLYYGWPENQLPNFKPDSGVSPAIHRNGHRQPESPREVATDLTIIAALLCFIKGELGNEKHPQFRSQAVLIEVLLSGMGSYPGLSERTLQDRFALANKVVKL